MINLINQKTKKSNLKSKYMQMRRALIFCEVKRKKLSRR